MITTIQRMLAPLHRRVMNLLSRGVVSKVDDSKKLQLLQLDLLDTETRDEIERFQNYGFTSVPEPGAESVVLFVGGRRDHGLAIAVDDRRYRLRSLVEGEVAVYNRTGASIVLKANGDIELTPAANRIVAIAGQTQPAVLGTDFKTAVSNALTSIAGALTTMGTAPAAPMLGALAQTAGTTVTAAVTTFNTAAGAALSTKVKLS